MRNDYYSNSNDYINRWVISYADFVTMLLALFMIMFATSSMGDSKVKDINKSIQKVFATKTVDKKVNNLDLKDEEINKTGPESIVNTGETILDGGDGILDGHKGILESDRLYEEIKNELNIDTRVKVIKESRGIVIRLNDTMLFDPGSAIIKKDAVITLDKIAKVLEGNKNPIVIEGHTDSMPISNEKYPSNWELSSARAINIISYLTQKHKFSPSRLSAVGYGEYVPIEDNSTPQGRAKNRRVDIIVLSSDRK